MVQDRINFNISRLDGLGQGVSKHGGITFIEKTLPTEQGTAVVYREAKGVRFAHLEELYVISNLRTQPACINFERCGGCQYLHTAYENEIRFKQQYLLALFKDFMNGNRQINIFPADKRFGYRNRIQLHYDTRRGDLGFISKFTENFISADTCLLPVEPVAQTVRELYRNDQWKEYISKSDPLEGTIEIYLKPGSEIPVISINKPYAAGGFFQINDEMNTTLKELLKNAYIQRFSHSGNPTVLDIFGGNGNLTTDFPNADVIIVDTHSGELTEKTKNRSRDYISLDLYRKTNIRKLCRKISASKTDPPEILIFDPPRKGVQFIETWMEYFSPDYIFYISCSPATLKRDTVKINQHYKINELNLIDFFPGTRHFETFTVFQKR